MSANIFLGKLEKMEIVSLTGNKTEGKVHDVFFNPESLKEEYLIELDENQKAGSNNNEMKFLSSKPIEMEFNLIFDSTGIFDEEFGQSIVKSAASFIGINKKKNIAEKVFEFKKQFIEVKGKDHEPNKAKFTWGKYSLTGKIKSLSIDYKLFNPDGTPIRAFVKLLVVESKSDTEAGLVNRFQSPDLTHYRTVKAGDTILLLTKEIYGDSKYYLEVAKVNNLVQFRSLKTGQTLKFPPIEKN